MGIATPLRVSPAYADREAVRSLVMDHSPYPLMAGSAGYGELMGSELSPWFRAHWALDGEAIDAPSRALLYHEPFVAAARQLYGAEVVRPAALIVNLMGPMAIGAAHVDTPTYRGLKRGAVPVWLLVTMGASGLFERWSVRVAGAITWFYEGSDGEFEYWPHGLGEAPEVERGPFGNVAVVGDNDLMPHRVGAIGNHTAFAARSQVRTDSVLRSGNGHSWEIVTGDVVTGQLGLGEVRISLLWKALTFENESAVREFEDHEDDLDVETIVSVFRADLARRGTPVDAPSDPFTDPQWSSALTSTYMQRR